MIVAPDKMDFSNKNLIMIVSGLPGTGKTTLALSAPDVLLIDTDNGACRVNPEHRKDTSICKTYEEILEDVKAARGKYKTIVIDTCGALIDYLKDWVVRTEPKASKNNGGISLQGFGFVKQEFLRLSNELRKDFNVVYLFHEQLERNNEDIIYTLLCEGSARQLVYQPADLAGHVFIQNGKRYIGFTPTEQYTAKSAYGIKGVIPIPELGEGDTNDFLTKLFDTVRDNLAAETKELSADKAKYDAAMKRGMGAINSIDKPELIEPCVEEIKQIDHALTSKKELQAALKKRLDELFVYDKETKSYKGKE